MQLYLEQVLALNSSVWLPYVLFLVIYSKCWQTTTTCMQNSWVLVSISFVKTFEKIYHNRSSQRKKTANTTFIILLTNRNQFLPIPVINYANIGDLWPFVLSIPVPLQRCLFSLSFVGFDNALGLGWRGTAAVLSSSQHERILYPK